MNKNFLHAAIALGLAASAAGQTTLQLEVTPAQGPVVHVVAGATVDYQVTGLLGGDASQGLCMFAFDAANKRLLQAVFGSDGDRSTVHNALTSAVSAAMVGLEVSLLLSPLDRWGCNLARPTPRLDVLSVGSQCDKRAWLGFNCSSDLLYAIPKALLPTFSAQVGARGERERGRGRRRGEKGRGRAQRRRD